MPRRPGDSGPFSPYDVDWTDENTPVPGDEPTLPTTEGPETAPTRVSVPRKVCPLCGAPLGTCATEGPASTRGGVSVLDLKAWADAQPGTGVKMALVLPDTTPHDTEADDE